MGDVRRGRPAGAHRGAARARLACPRRARRPAPLALSRVRSRTCARADRGASRSRTGRRPAACSTPRSTSAGRSSSSSRGACSRWRSSRPTGASCASSCAPTATRTDVRVTQRGFEGNEDWLADFRGGWGSFNDRLAMLCEIGVTAAPRHIEADARGGAHVRARRGARRHRAARGSTVAVEAVLLRRRRPHHGGRAREPTPATATASRRDEACDALCVDAAAHHRSGSSPREPRCARCRAAAGRRPARCARPSTPPTRSSAPSCALPYRPALGRRPRALRARVRARVLRARPRRGRLLLRSAAARSRSPAGRTRARSTRRSRACPRVPSRASGGCGSPDGVLTADWEGNGWTAGRNRGTSTWTFAEDGRIERLILRFDPSVERMVAA